MQLEGVYANLFITINIFLLEGGGGLLNIFFLKAISEHNEDDALIKKENSKKKLECMVLCFKWSCKNYSSEDLLRIIYYLCNVIENC